MSPLHNSSNNAMPVGPAPSLLAEDIHGYGCKHNRRCNATDDKEAIPHSLDHDPVIGVEGQPKGEHVFDKVHDGKRLRGLLAMAVHDVRHYPRRAELDAEIDEAQAHDHGHGPRVLGIEGLAPGEEPYRSEEQVRSHDGQTELGL